MNRASLKTVAVMGTIAGCLLFAGAAMAEEDKPSADFTASIFTKYVWRGFELSKDSLVAQPSATVSYKGFSANFWANLDTDLHENLRGGTAESDSFTWTETDLTLAYEWTMGPVTASVGYIYYLLNDSLVFSDDTQEVFASATLDVLLSPTIKIYRDFDHLAGWYITAGVSHSIPLDKMSLDLAAQAGYLNADEASSYAEVDSGDAYGGLLDGNISMSLGIPVTDSFTVTPTVYYSFPLSSDAGDLIEAASVTGNDDNYLYAGVSMSFSF